MKRKMFLTAVIAASLILTACESEKNSSTDTPTNASTEASVENAEIQENTQQVIRRVEATLYPEYKEYLDYALPSGYTVSEPYWNLYQTGTEYEQEAVTWDFNMKSKNGKDMQEKLLSSECVPAEIDLYGSKEVHDLIEIDSFITLTMGHVARDEFAEKIASKYLDIEYDAISDTYITPEGELTVLAYTPVYIGGVDESQFDKSVDIVRERITAGSGFSIADADIESICGSKDFIFSCKFVLDEGVDTDGYVELMENIMKDYQELVGTPQNYSFFLAQYGNDEWLMRRMHIMGEEIPSDKIDSGEFNFSSELKNAIIESH